LFTCFVTVGHLNKFYFCHKRIEKMRSDYGTNSYRDEFSNFLSRPYFRASAHASSHVLSRFSYRHNHRSYDFGSTLVTTHVLIIVIVSCVGPIFLLDALILTLSPNT
jgi:hypothetical protein